MPWVRPLSCPLSASGDVYGQWCDRRASRELVEEGPEPPREPAHLVLGEGPRVPSLRWTVAALAALAMGRMMSCSAVQCRLAHSRRNVAAAP